MSDRETRDFEPESEEMIEGKDTIKSWKGGEYVVAGFSRDSEDQHIRVHYRPALEPYALPWSRPLAEFYQEVRDDSGRWVRRFEVVK